jgi:hypothetical protein
MRLSHKSVYATSVGSTDSTVAAFAVADADDCDCGGTNGTIRTILRTKSYEITRANYYD